MGSAGYHNISNTLTIFLNNIEASYVYAIRQEDDGSFIITVDPTAENMTEYGIPLEATDALIAAGNGTTSVENTPTTDEWGTFYSAYSPVFDSDGNVGGIIGVDFTKEWYEDQINDQYRRILLSFLIILLITMPIIVLMCLFTIRTITRPIRQLTAVASEYEKGNFSHEIEIYEEDEIGILSKTLKSMASSLTEQIKRAEEASQAKSNFLANMSHEIRTPINAVLGMNEMILRESSEPEIRSYSDNIKSAGTTLLNIINDILDFSKIEAGKMEIVSEDYDLFKVLNDLVNMIRPRLDAKNLELKLDFDPNIPRHLVGDSKRIKQIITNILTNAAKYTEEGSVAFKVGFEKACDEPDCAILQVSVSDTGIGIKPEDMKKLFSEFERIEEKRNRNIEGTGLGMNITQSLLNMMGSSLEVESIYGEGSTFHFALKQKISGEELLGDFTALCKPEQTQEKTYKEKFTAPDARILVVDDNPMNLIVFTNLIKKTLIVTDTANSGDEALSMMKAQKYHAIFLDHMMPNKDGIATLHELKQDLDNPNLNTPVICLTANAISGAKQEYLDAGFDDYLTKPIQPDKFEDMLIKYLPDELIELTKDDEKAASDAPPEIPIELTPLLNQNLISIKAGIDNSGGEDSFLSMLEIFESYADGNLEELCKFYSDEDFDSYTIKIHALKSSSRIIGALGLAQDAQDLENAGKAGEYDKIRVSHNDYVQKFQLVTDLIRQVLDKKNESKAPTPSAGSLLINEAYNQIRKSAKAMDYDTIEAVYKEMSAYSIPDDAAPLWNQVKNAFEMLDFEKIETLLK